MHSSKIILLPRPVIAGQNIAIKIEQTHPSLILKLAGFSSLSSSQKNVSGNSTKETLSLNSQASDKTSIQNRSADSILGSPLSNKNVASDVKSGQAPSDGKVMGPFSKADLKQLGIRVGQKEQGEVLRVIDQETLQIRFKGNDVPVKYAASQKLQPGDPVYFHAKSIPSGKFVLALENVPVSSSATQPSLELSVLKNYLSARQPLAQVLTGLKEVFLEGALTQLKEFNMDPGPLKQLQANLQKLVSKEFKASDAAQLKEMIDRSGAHYESRVKEFMLEPNIANKNVLLGSDLKGNYIPNLTKD